MDQKADVVIIGGGCTGTSIALHLARRKFGKIILVEKGGVASGQTGMSSAIIRLRYWNEVTARIALKAWKIFNDFPNRIGGQCGFRKSGVLWLVDKNNLESMSKNMELIRQVGGDASMITNNEILEIEPLLSLEGVEGAGWEPNSGYADPALTTDSYVRESSALGVELRQSTKVESIVTGGGHVKAVVTDSGTIDTNKVVNAAGFWSKGIGANLGINLPIIATRRHIGLFRRPEGYGNDGPVVSDFVTGNYYRPFGRAITRIGSSYDDRSAVEPDRIDTSVAWEAIESMAEAFSTRFPKLGIATYDRGFSYPYDTTPDHHPILDEITTSGIEGYYCACGFSGHGFKESPVVGEIMADYLANGTKKGSTIDFFRFSRFEEGKLIYSPFAGG